MGTTIFGLTFSNPRQVAEFSDWPIGGSARGHCKFWVETTKRGHRVGRQTTDKHGRLCKPKYTTYGGKCAIVDGSDGRTYILRHAGCYPFVTISRSDFLDHGSVHDSQHLEDYKALCAMIDVGQGVGAEQVADA